MATQRPRKFAPLASSSPSKLPKLRGIVFDVDGTLCEPQTYMFGQMRTVLGIPKSVDILDHIYSLPQDAQERAMGDIRKIESDAMEKQTPQPGLTELMDYLDRQKIQKALCTRNFESLDVPCSLPVNHLLTTFLPNTKFQPVITRAFRPPKPDPAGILHIAEQWGLSNRGTDLIMVGDSLDDMTAGYMAGAATVLLVSDVNEHLGTHAHTDICIRRLNDLIPILEKGFEGRLETQSG